MKLKEDNDIFIFNDNNNLKIITNSNLKSPSLLKFRLKYWRRELDSAGSVFFWYFKLCRKSRKGIKVWIAKEINASKVKDLESLLKIIFLLSLSLWAKKLEHLSLAIFQSKHEYLQGQVF
jgi:hypothetical protein